MKETPLVPIDRVSINLLSIKKGSDGLWHIKSFGIAFIHYWDALRSAAEVTRRIQDGSHHERFLAAYRRQKLQLKQLRRMLDQEIRRYLKAEGREHLRFDEMIGLSRPIQCHLTPENRKILWPYLD